MKCAFEIELKEDKAIFINLSEFHNLIVFKIPQLPKRRHEIILVVIPRSLKILEGDFELHQLLFEFFMPKH